MAKKSTPRTKSKKRKNDAAFEQVLYVRKQRNINWAWAAGVIILVVAVIAFWQWSVSAGFIADDNPINSIQVRAIIYMSALVAAGFVGLKIQKANRQGNEALGLMQMYGISEDEMLEYKLKKKNARK